MKHNYNDKKLRKLFTIDNWPQVCKQKRGMTLKIGTLLSTNDWRKNGQPQFYKGFTELIQVAIKGLFV